MHRIRTSQLVHRHATCMYIYNESKSEGNSATRGLTQSWERLNRQAKPKQKSKRLGFPGRDCRQKFHACVVLATGARTQTRVFFSLLAWLNRVTFSHSFHLVVVVDATRACVTPLCARVGGGAARTPYLGTVRLPAHFRVSALAGCSFINTLLHAQDFQQTNITRECDRTRVDTQQEARLHFGLHGAAAPWRRRAYACKQQHPFHPNTLLHTRRSTNKHHA